MLILALAAAVAVATPDPAVAEITRLEQQWGQAFVTRDFRFIKRIVAPEYRLVGASADGKYVITRRAEWMKNSRAFRTLAFAVDTVDVNRVGNTAVVSAQGLWTVSRRPGRGSTRHALLCDRHLGSPQRAMAGSPSVFPPPSNCGMAASDARILTAEVTPLLRAVKRQAANVRFGSKVDIRVPSPFLSFAVRLRPGVALAINPTQTTAATAWQRSQR
jgi:hypothetical protein